MAIKDLIPWSRGQAVARRGGEDLDPFVSLHREMNRLFDEAFRGFDLSPFGTASRLSPGGSWPALEVSETEKEIQVTAELPGLEEKDIDVRLSNGVLAISGERHSEKEDKGQFFSERYYGRFERAIPVEDIDESKISASFKNGLLTVTLPKAPSAARTKHIAIKSS